MSIRPAWILGACLSACAGAALADLYKWVDETGTVHFAEICPEGVECTMVRTLPPRPGPESGTPARAMNDLAAQRALQPQQEAERPHAAREERSRRAAADAVCETLFAEREILELTLPIYRDDQLRLHYRDSLHHHWYEGERHYLEDRERAEQLTSVRKRIGTECAGLEPGRTSYVHRFRYPPLPTEVLGLLDEMLTPAGPLPDEVCAFAQRLLEDQRALRTGIPSSDERELQRLMSERCR